MLSWIDASRINAEEPLNEETLLMAHQTLWPVAHYWAAKISTYGDADIPTVKDPSVWSRFMNLAESYRFSGCSLGIFEDMAPSGAFDEKQIRFDPKFSGLENLLLLRLSKRERADIENCLPLDGPPNFIVDGDLPEGPVLSAKLFIDPDCCPS